MEGDEEMGFALDTYIPGIDRFKTMSGRSNVIVGEKVKRWKEWWRG